MSDDDAIIYMVDSNLYREEILPSEKALSYKMRYEAMKRQGYRTDLHSSAQSGRKLETTDILGMQVGEQSSCSYQPTYW